MNISSMSLPCLKSSHGSHTPQQKITQLTMIHKALYILPAVALPALPNLYPWHSGLLEHKVFLDHARTVQKNFQR